MIQTEKKQRTDIPGNGPVIEVMEVTKDFGSRIILRNINFCIQRGEIFGLLGPSGAGKTTLVRILTGQLPPSDGSVKLFGNPMGEFDTAVSRRLGMVLDELGLYERLTCGENLQLFAEIYGLSPMRGEELLERVGLKEARKQQVSRLSKGMKQRLTIARALLHQPEILFLDEPTSGLDPGTGAQIHSLLLEEQKKGTAIFLTTHNMEEAAKLCDHVALLHQGVIVEYGNPKEICRRYDHQNQIYILQKNGEQLILKNDGSSAEILASCARENQIESIHSTEPNLETVFMELTGRGLSA